MRKKLKKIAVLLFLFTFVQPVAASADDDYFRPVEPNRYEEKENRLPVEYIHEKELLQQRRKLPEEQLLLTFEPQQPDDRLESIVANLFQSTDLKVHSLAVKTTELNLFHEIKDLEPVIVMEDERLDQREARGLTLAFGFITVTIIGYLLYAIVPRLE